MSFESLGLHPVLLSALVKAGFKEPTSVQSAAIPKALNGADLIVSAQTGSGKTAAFMLPSLNTMTETRHEKAKSVQTLVLTPTRELAQQIAVATKLYSSNIKDLRIATIVGGMPYGPQIKALSSRVDVLVATPGRLLDHINAGRVKLSGVKTLVLDEADRMLDMGFIQDIQTIVESTPANRQTLMFSATFEKNVAKLASDMLTNPERIDIANQRQKHANIKQSLLFADNAGHKFRLLEHILTNDGVYQAIVFSATKRSADDLADRLADQGFKAGALHGDMNQRQRSRTLKQLQSGRLQVLVATDVAARGIDVQGITHAINFDLPMQAEDYVHRIGRTGRAGRDGRAYSLATFSERFKVRKIEQFTGQPLETEEIEGMEPIRQSAKSKPSNGGRKPSSSNNRKPYAKRASNGAPARSRNPQERSGRSDRSESSYGERSSAPREGRENRFSEGREKRSFEGRENRYSEGREKRSFEGRDNREGRENRYSENRENRYSEGRPSRDRNTDRNASAARQDKPFKKRSPKSDEFMTGGEFKQSANKSSRSKAAASRTGKPRVAGRSKELLDRVNQSISKRKVSNGATTTA